ncbi:MAG: thioredoxin domain-containing protein [Candidatus Solibacter sp.]
MENNEMQDPRTGEWVEERMASLDPSKNWKPDAAQGLNRFHHMQKARHRRFLGAVWAAVAASVAGVALFLAAPAACAGAGCAKPSNGPVSAEPLPAPAPAAIPVPTPEPAAPASPVAAAPAPAPVPAPVAAPFNYKAQGSEMAPITVELYTDYECPHCATVFMGVVPEFVRDYVKTGKVRFIHRDFPLNMHQYAKLAARYANAAGTLGHYDAVVHQLFRTQNSWALTGDIGTQVAQVLPPAVMDKVRNLVANDAHLDDTVSADVAAGQQVRLTMTPTMVVTYKGKTQMLAPVPQYELLKSYLDELLAK